MKPIELQEIIDEVARATKQHPEWPSDAIHAAAIIGEEYGELTKEILQVAYEPHKTTIAAVRKEAIHTAAMALRFAYHLDTYTFRTGYEDDVSGTWECAR